MDETSYQKVQKGREIRLKVNEQTNEPTSKSGGELLVVCFEKLVAVRSCSGRGRSWVLRWCEKGRCSWGEMRAFIFEEASGVKS